MAKQTPGSKCDTGSKYELGVTALFASLLSKNENVEDYSIFSNLADAQPFDDIVAVVHFKGLEHKQIYAIQVKSGKDKLNINKYCDGYDKIIGEGGLKLGENVRNDRISFWYFCSKTPAKKTFAVVGNADTVDLKLQPRCRPYNIHETIFDKALSHGLFSENSNIHHQNFFESFYLFFNQPDTDKVIYIIKGIWNIDKPWSILQYLDNYLAKNSNGLDKATFEHELLKIRLSDYVVTPTAAIAVQQQPMAEWNRLTLKQDITIVQNETNIEPYLFGCILQNISDLISIEEWNHTIDNLGKLDRDLKTSLKAKSFKADTLKELMFQAWVDRKTPLLLRTDTSLPLLKEFSHLKKHYVIIDSNVDKRYKEINSYELSGFRHLGDVEAYGLTKVILVSLQGRKPASLHEIINEDKKLKETVTCLDIINLIKPREAYLKRECLERNDYMLFLVETADLQKRKHDKLELTGCNIVMCCGPNESESKYIKYRSEPRFKNYKILRMRSTDDGKLKPLPKIQRQYDEEYRGLECFFVDQNGEIVYYMADGTTVPVIGEVQIHTDTHFRWKYIPRYLREGTKKDEAIPSNEDAYNDLNIEYSNQMLAERDFFKECGGKVNVITGEPGIGKTMLLHSLFDFCESKYYVLFVDLSRFRSDLLSGKLKSCRHLLDLSRNKCRSLPYNCLLNSLHNYPNRFVLMLDSFDEIVPTCKQQVLELVKSIECVSLQNVIIASRLTSLNLSVDNCEAKIFKIQCLNERSDKHYIDDWNLDIEKLRHIPSEFLTTPLYLNMLRSLSDNGMNVEIVNRWNIYESVLRLKMEDYSLRKCLDEDEKQFILAKHGEMALKVIFGANKVTKKLEYSVQPNNSNFIRLGFITHFDNENPAFIHRTFAEFFVVKWLIQNIGRDHAADIYKLILDNGDEDILDMYSGNFPLHKAILENDIDNVRRLCKENRKCLMETDDLGRNALHLAAISSTYYDSKVLDFLLLRMRNEGCDVHVRDKIMKWKWIDYYESRNFANNLFESFPIKEAYLDYYATHVEELEHCKYSLCRDFNKLYDDAVCQSSISLVRNLLFLKYHNNKAFLKFREMCVSSCEIRVNLIKLPKGNLKGIHLACIYGNFEAVKAYIKSGADFTKTDKFNCTPLHYCVIAGQREEVVKLLLDICGIPSLCAGLHNDTTILHMSVQAGNVNVTKMILDRIDDQAIGTLLNGTYSHNRTPLQLAVEYENNDMVELLLQRRANPILAETDLASPLLLALESRNGDVVEMLLKYGANAHGDFGVPLRHGIRTSQMAMIELLLQNRANVNHVDQCGWTLLTYAIHQNASKELVQILLNYGADVNLKDRFGETPMSMAIKRGHLKIIELLLINKARLDCMNSSGWTPLIFAIMEGRKDIVQMLLDGINIKGKRGTTPLCVAIKINNADIVQILLDHEADVNSVDAYGLSPLLTAVEMETLQTAEMLLHKGADVNFKNEYGITALYTAAFKRNAAMVELLLKHGADVNAITFYEEILHKAKSAKKIEIVIWLLKNRNILTLSSAFNLTTNIIENVTENWSKIDLKKEVRATVHQQLVDSNTIEILMEWGGKIDIEDEFWKIVFYLLNEMNYQQADSVFFCNLGYRERCRLIEKICGAASDENLDITKILWRHRGYRKRILLTAIRKKNTRPLEIILENFDVEIFKQSEFLHIAVLQQNIDIVKMLLEYGSPINSEATGFTPLLVAVSTGNIAIVEVLLTKGADTNFRERDSGVTALFIAALKNNRSMVRKLLEYGANKNVKISKDSMSLVAARLRWCDIDLSINNASEIINKVKQIIEEESTGIGQRRNGKVTTTWLGKIWRRY